MTASFITKYPFFLCFISIHPKFIIKDALLPSLKKWFEYIKTSQNLNKDKERYSKEFVENN